jgi:hypothetical protein
MSGVLIPLDENAALDQSHFATMRSLNRTIPFGSHNHQTPKLKTGTSSAVQHLQSEPPLLNAGENDGKASSSKPTKHVDIRHCFVTDRINKKDLTVEWCPTGDMIGNCMTKLNQGALFIKFRDQIMGVALAKDPGPGSAKRVSIFLNNSVVQQDRKSKLAPKNALDGEHERTTTEPTDRPCQQTRNGTCPQKTKERSSDSKKPQQGAKKNAHTQTTSAHVC